MSDLLVGVHVSILSVTHRLVAQGCYRVPSMQNEWHQLQVPAVLADLHSLASSCPATVFPAAK